MECSPRAPCKGARCGAHLMGLGALLLQCLGREQRRALFSDSPLLHLERVCQLAQGLAYQSDHLPRSKGGQGSLVDIEQHAFMLVLLNVLVTKGESMLMPSTQVEQVQQFLHKYEALFPEKAQEVSNKIRLGGSDRDYVGSVKELPLLHITLSPP